MNASVIDDLVGLTRAGTKARSAGAAFRGVERIDDMLRPATRAMRPVAKVATAPVVLPAKGAAAAGRALLGPSKPLRKRATSIAIGASVAIGIPLGLASGARGSLQDINKAAGNPVGAAADLSIRTAFSGNSSDSRSRRGGASGNITLNMR